MEVIYQDNAGGKVFCDGCNTDGDALDPDGKPIHMGGGLIGSYALCQECYDKAMADPEAGPIEPGEGPFNPNRSFGCNVRVLRLELYGTADLITIVYAEDKDNGQIETC